jgi:hypothetical protein
MLHQMPRAVAIRGFRNYTTDRAYGWAAECENRFGTHPVQVLNEVNDRAAQHSSQCRHWSRPALPPHQEAGAGGR